MIEDKISAIRVIDALAILYPDAGPELHFTNPFETLIATILSAQCTDKRVNAVTEKLFAIYPDAQSLACVAPSQLEMLIRECGLYHNKAKNIIAACQALVAEYDGQVPNDRAKLMALPGVGQKTAGVVLMAAFGEPQLPVDTHVFRVSRRIGLADANDPKKVEKQLCAVIPKDKWIYTHHLLIWHGRRVCHALKPNCASCPLQNGLCERRGV